MILAATAGHDKVCEILLDHSADIEAQSERTKDTPLSLACSGGRYEVVEVLLRRNANKEHRNVSDYTPLALAASGGYVTIIKLLLAHGAEINSRTGSKLGISPLVSFKFFSIRIPRRFPKIPKKFPKNSQKIPKKFSKHSDSRL